MLSLLKLDFETLASLHRPRAAKARREFDRRVAALVRGIDLSMNTVRRIAAELRPNVFEDLGLAAALTWQLQEFESRTGIRCRRRGLSHSAGLAAEPSLAVFRIFTGNPHQRHSPRQCHNSGSSRRDRSRLVHLARQ